MTTIEVYADIWCPFAYVGLHTVARRRDELGRHDVAMRIRPWPLELVNGSPLDPAVTAHHVSELRAQVAPGLFRGFDPSRFPLTSLPVLALEAAAYRQGSLGEEVSFALRDALFERGEDVSQPEVLSRIASEHGVAAAEPEDAQAVLDQWHQGQSRGVRGSPHFFCGTQDVFCPSLDITKKDGHLLLRRNAEALDGFLQACVG